MRPMTIDIDELAFALDTPGIDHYLDLYSGKVLLISAERPIPNWTHCWKTSRNACC